MNTNELADVHPFANIAWRLIPESTQGLYLRVASSFPDHQRDSYRTAGDALRKWQWSSLAAHEAVDADAEMLRSLSGGSSITAGPKQQLLQVKHDRALSEFVLQSRSSMDSASVFLNELLALGFSGAHRDLRRGPFRKALVDQCPEWAETLSESTDWMQRLGSTRDALSHWTSYQSMVFLFDEGLGAMPVPRRIGTMSLPKSVRSSQTAPELVSTRSFVAYHGNSIHAFFHNLLLWLCRRMDLRLSGPVRPSYWWTVYSTEHRSDLRIVIDT